MNYKIIASGFDVYSDNKMKLCATCCDALDGAAYGNNGMPMHGRSRMPIMSYGDQIVCPLPTPCPRPSINDLLHLLEAATAFLHDPTVLTWDRA